MSTDGYYRWSRDITRKLDTMIKKDRQKIIRIMDKEVAKTYDTIINNTPYRTGELQRNVFFDHEETDYGYKVGVGIATTKHNPDKFTNTKLAGWLIAKPNSTKYNKYREPSNSQQQMVKIANALYDLKYNIRAEINAYWKSKQDNGGK